MDLRTLRVAFPWLRLSFREDWICVDLFRNNSLVVKCYELSLIVAVSASVCKQAMPGVVG